MEAPEISFIIPAYNAAKTLSDCIDSLKAQTIGHWEAVVVDDGSADETLELARAIATADGRIKVLHQANAGASAARNTAVGHAAAPYIVMLDADDWVDPAYIEAMLPVAKAHPNTVPYCDFQYALDKQRMLGLQNIIDLSGATARRELADRCHFAIHCAVVPRQAYLDFGGLDPTLATCEDWDLWLKMAFGGVAFVHVTRCLSFYRMHPGTLSGDPYNMLRDGITVMARANALVAAQNSGAPAVLTYDRREVFLATWFAALFARKGVDVDRLFSFVPEIGDHAGNETHIAETIVDALYANDNAADWDAVMAEQSLWEPVVEQVLDILQTASLPGLKRRIWVQIARKLDFTVPIRVPTQVGHVLIAPVDMRALQTIAKPPTADVAMVSFLRGRKRCGSWEVPLFDDLTIADLQRLLARNFHPRSWRWIGDRRVYRPLARALLVKRQGLVRTARRHGWLSRPLLNAFRDIFAALPAPRMGGANTGAMQALIEETRRQARPSEDDGAASVHYAEDLVDGPQANTADYWEALFQREDPWDYLSAYETRKYEQTLELLPEGPIGRALEIACAEGIFTLRLAERVAHLTAVDISMTAIQRARQRCRERSNIDYGVLDLYKDPVPPGQDLIVCSEVLYYLKDAAQLRGVAEKFAAALAPGGVFVTAHAFLQSDSPGRTGFAWENPFGTATIRKVFSAVPGLALEEVVETELYQVLRFRKLAPGQAAARTVVRQADYGRPLTARVASFVVWHGTPKGDARASGGLSRQVPVLMYHRVAADGPADLAPYRVSAEQFEQQMLYLQQAGFYSITSSELSRHMNRGTPFQGRPVLITFDDAYRDFFDTALPILRKHGFNAELFVVADKVGACADWDSRYGDPAPLMDWQDIIDAQAAGTTIGSHLATHRPASSLPSDVLLAEAVRSRTVLEQRLAATVQSIALPFGDIDNRVAPILRASGYAVAFGTAPDVAELHSPVMAVPRFNIGGDMDTDAFASLVDRH